MTSDQQRAYNRAYYQAHQEEMREYKRLRYQEHKPEHIARVSRWKADNPERVRAARQRYYQTHREEIKLRRHLKRVAEARKEAQRANTKPDRPGNSSGNETRVGLRHGRVAAGHADYAPGASPERG